MITKTCFVAAALALAACRGERQASAAAADTASSGPAVGGVGTAVAALQPFEQVVTAIGIVTPRAVAVRARISRPVRPLRIGESIFGRLVTADHARAVTVPVSALVPSGDRFQVFVVDSGGIAHTRAVTVGARNAS